MGESSAPRQITTLLPHRGALMLLDEATCVDDDQAHARARIRPDHPLLCGQTLPAWALIEYLAQAAAALCGYHSKKIDENRMPRPGYLVAIRDAVFYQPEVSVGDSLEIRIRQEGHHDPFFQFVGEVLGTSGLLCQGKISVFIPASLI